MTTPRSTRGPIDPLRLAARVTIEMTGPFLVGSGEHDWLADALPVRDALGLPAIPGSSLAGVLRHAYAALPGAGVEADDLFGSAGSPSSTAGTGAAGSRLWVSWAHIHGADDVPMDGVLPWEPRAEGDVVLADARGGALRDHVRLNASGAVDGDGKFDETVVHAGHRFTFDLLLEGHERHENAFGALLGLLAHGGLRLGRGGRRGLGSFKVVRLHRGRFDLRRAEDAQAFALLPVRLDRPVIGLTDLSARLGTLPDPSLLRAIVVVMDLEALEPFSSRGADGWGTPEGPDMEPVLEERIVWSRTASVTRGAVSPAPCAFLPGSAIKGALAHRVAFHANASAGACVRGPDFELPPSSVGEQNAAVRALFGCAKAERRPEAGDTRADDASDPTGRAGCVYVDDVWLDPLPAHQVLAHNGIDRFTGGTLPGVLFQERVFLPGTKARVCVRIERPGELDTPARTALAAALRDLAEGRLALGGGSSRGLGWFRATSIRGLEDLLAAGRAGTSPARVEGVGR